MSRCFLVLAGATLAASLVRAEEPDDYLEYVETTGKQYVDTEVLANGRIDIETRMAWTTVTQSREGIWGARNLANGAGWFGASRYTGKWGLTYAGGYVQGGTYTVDAANDVTIRLKSGDMAVLKDGTSAVSRKDSLFDTELPGYLFALNECNAKGVSVANYLAHVRCYGVTITSDHLLVRDYRPAVKDGLPCLYDRVNRRLYYAQGTNTAQMTMGPVLAPTVDVSVEPASFANVVSGGIGEKELTDGSYAFALVGDGPVYMDATGDLRGTFDRCDVTPFGGATETEREPSFTRAFAHPARAVWRFSNLETRLTVSAATGGSAVLGGETFVGTAWVTGETPVTLTAVPDAGYRCVGWTGDTDGCIVSGGMLIATMDHPRTVAPVFERTDRVTLTVDRVASRYPWNGIVDIDYTIGFADPGDGLEPLNERLRIAVIDNATDPATTNFVHRILGNDLPVTAGSHHIAWAANYDGAAFVSDNVTVRMEIVRYPDRYAVVDVSGGDNVAAYPVTFHASDPSVGDVAPYKLDRILLKFIPPGRFWMGSPTTEQGRQGAREARHHVTLTEPFYLGVYETTQRQYSDVMQANPSGTKAEDLPVAAVSYNAIRGEKLGARWPADGQVDATSFMGRLRARTGLAFDLPTEAQWEYACRAGTDTPFNDAEEADPSKTYEDTYAASMALLGRFKGNYEDGTAYNKTYTTVGSYNANGWGLYDMHGNVSEWCLDWHVDALESLGQYVDPRGPGSGSYRATRGGYNSANAVNCRSAKRFAYDDGNNGPAGNRPFFGFRIAMPVDAAAPAPFVLAADEKTDVSLDLSAIWDRTDLSAIGVAYSAVGWALTADESDRTVTLAYFKTNEEASAATEIASGLTGCGTQTWTPSGVAKDGYELRHSVYDGLTEVAGERLSAFFTFANCQMEATPEEVRDAVLGIGEPCIVTNDADHPWQPLAGAGSGAAAPAGTNTQIGFAVAGEGALSFGVRLDGGTLAVLVDGVSVATYDSVADWTAVTLPIVGRTAHTVAFAYTAADGTTSAALRGVSWKTDAGRLSAASCDGARVDLREGAKTIMRREQLLPFVYSHTNFVGVAGATAESVARVSIVRLAPDEPTDDLSLWTNAVAGTERVLREESDESSVRWRGHGGVWRATFDILNGEDTVHTETAIFDMREFCPGFMLMLK